MHDCHQPAEDGIKPARDGHVIWVSVSTYSGVQMSENTFKIWEFFIFFIILFYF